MSVTVIQWEDNRYRNPYQIIDNDVGQEPINGAVLRCQMQELHKIRVLNNIPSLIKVSGKYSFEEDNKSTDVLFEQINDTIRTGNMVGVVTTPGNTTGNQIRIEITSRFDRMGKNFFLIYLLSNVYGFELYNETVHTENNTSFDAILCILFFEKLKEAYSYGLFKVYKNFEYNDYNFKGSLALSRHIKFNTPFLGKTAYTVREYTYDNDLLCMIRQTMDYIHEKYTYLWDSYMNYQVELDGIIKVIEEATPSYQKNSSYQHRPLCQKIVTHPMFGAYEEVRLLCQRILSEDGDNVFHMEDYEAKALLIDMAWLWEEFVAQKLLDNMNYIHLCTQKGRNRTGIPYAEKKIWYPDFVENVSDTKARRNIIDAKYKHWNYERDDMHQLLSYLYLTGGNVCGAVFPVNYSEMEKEITRLEIKPYNQFYQQKVYCCKFPFIIPEYDDTTSYTEFEKKMARAIGNWKESFIELQAERDV